MSESLPFAKKALGQHWLADEAALAAMVAAAEVAAGDVVLEIGPGAGTLTRQLVAAVAGVDALGRYDGSDDAADRGSTGQLTGAGVAAGAAGEMTGEVVAVEFDERLAAELPRRVPSANLRVVCSDILRFDLTQLPADYKVVANIPYYLTSNLLRQLSESANPPRRAAILVQKEVAERVAAAPGDMSLLSVTAQYYWQVSLGQVVAADLFTPPPKVDSRILILRRREDPLFDDVDPQLFFRLAKAGFGERRKTLRNALSGGLHIGKPDAEQLLRSAGLDAGRRAQTLSLAQWHDLYRAWRDAG